MNRKNFISALSLLCTAAFAPPLLAQATLASVGVFSLLGDSVQVRSANDAPTDTRIERSSSESMDFKGIGFDLIALRSARTALQRSHPAARMVAFAGPTPLTVAEQRAVADGALKAELPGWMVKTAEDNRLSHLLILTRTRGAMDARTGDQVAIGRGTVEGIGFYMDTLYTMRNIETGALSTGLLAPYIQIRLTLMDAQSGDIVSTYDVRESFAFASKETQVKADPWSFMSPSEKILTLREMVEKGVARGVEQLSTKR